MRPSKPRNSKDEAAEANPPVMGAEFLLSMVEERCVAKNGNGNHMDSRGQQELEKIEQQIAKLQASAQDDVTRHEIHQLHQRISVLREQVSVLPRAWQKAELARAHGCDATIVYSKEDFVGAVRRLTDGKGVAAVFDSVGKDTFEKSLRCLAPRGLLASFGTASGPIASFDVFELNRLDSLYVTSPAYVTHTRDRTELLRRADALFGAIAAGIVKVKVGRTYPLADAARAHEDMQARRTTGVGILVP